MGFPGIGSWIERRAARSPSNVALVTEDGTRTYTDLAREIRAVASLLQATGSVSAIESHSTAGTIPGRRR